MDVLKAIASVFLAAALLYLPVSVDAEPGTGTRAEEHVIKAAFIYNFTKFVTWPATAFENVSDPIRICVVEDNELAEALETLADKSKGRPLRVVRYRNIADADKSHLVFVGESADDALIKKILYAVVKRPVLTVGDTSAFVRQGGMIGFISTGKKLTFEINPALAKRSGLEISFKMLSLAKIVREQP